MGKIISCEDGRVTVRVLGQGLRLASIGAAIGLLGALAASRVTQGLDVFGQLVRRSTSTMAHSPGKTS